LAALCVAVAGCSAEGDSGSGKRRAMTDPFGNATAGGGGNGSAGTAARPAVRNPAQVDLGAGEVCDADSYSAERRQLDIYMVVDDSGSMVPWWPFTLDAISQFFYDQGSHGIGVGLQFFGSSCDVAYYATPRVAISALPAAIPALEQAFPIIPVEGTAMVPAMQGAVQHAREFMTQHPQSKTVVLLVTDGLPDDCNSTAADVAAAAKAGLEGSPSVQTFVIGIGLGLDALNSFAEAGGSQKAFLVEPGAPQALLTALNQIRGQALPCDYALPASDGSVDTKRVNLRHTAPSGTAETIGWVSGADACDPAQDGWYYDDPNDPRRLIVCPNRCTRLKETGGEVQVLLGCPRVEIDVM
jgi:hypothetical protein